MLPQTKLTMSGTQGTAETWWAIAPRSLEPPKDTVAYWGLMGFIFLLFLAPQAFFPALGVVRPAFTAGGLAFMAYFSGRLLNGQPLYESRKEFRLLAWFVVFSVISIPFSVWPGGSFSRLTYGFSKCIIIFFLLAQCVNSPRRIKQIIEMLTTIGIVIALTALSHYMSGELNSEGRISGYGSPLASNPNDLALTLNLILGLTIGLLWGVNTSWKRTLLYALSGLFVVGIVITFSRAGFIGLMTTFGLVLIRVSRERRLPTLVSMLLLLTLLAAVLIPSGYLHRLESITDFQKDATGSAQARWAGMITALKLMVENPFTGTGFDMDILALREKLGDDYWYMVHNVYLQIGADIGMPGLVVFLMLVVHLVKGLQRSLGQLHGQTLDPRLHSLGYGIRISLLAFLVQALFYPVAYDFFFYVIAGLACAFQDVTKRFSTEAERSVLQPGTL